MPQQTCISKLQQERVCNEKFKKDCTIQYKSVPKSETVRTCSKKARRDCDAEGPRVCTTEHETSE